MVPSCTDSPLVYMHPAGSNQIRICSGSTPIALKGVNWFGFETTATLVDGLWMGPTALTLDFITVLRRIKLLGFNTIRLPMSLKVRRTVSVKSWRAACHGRFGDAWLGGILALRR